MSSGRGYQGYGGVSRARWGVPGCTRPLWGRFWGFLGGIYLGAYIPGFSLLHWTLGRVVWCLVLFGEARGLPGGFCGVLCSLGRQGGTNRRAKAFSAGATIGADGCQGQFGGFQGVLGQFQGVFRVFRRVYTLGPLYQVFPYSCGLLGGLFGGGKGAPIGGQNVLRVGLPKARTFVKRKLAGSGLYSANLGCVFRVFHGVFITGPSGGTDWWQGQVGGICAILG